ncbi:uncharacterized protein Tco025E_04516 [Trypanosoma conorhini]|uniref:Uncharacterized protein n=1 Tax=Trypanosoma conorhini TaxID=83891 RepID=A0A422PL03_9TRYP|nr:uncharacterized protein Tco025E_04516 [Trypanosoma conorhini]RNF18399.1 hypothetical protein Tco025E_04516 [Trypanosoma conorhini]
MPSVADSQRRCSSCWNSRISCAAMAQRNAQNWTLVPRSCIGFLWRLSREKGRVPGECNRLSRECSALSEGNGTLTGELLMWHNAIHGNMPKSRPSERGNQVFAVSSSGRRIPLICCCCCCFPALYSSCGERHPASQFRQAF